jgi:hypothetical protein
MTGLEHLNTMPYKLQVLFLKRLSEWGKYGGMEGIAGYLNNEFVSFYEFICGAFTWIATAEGHDYWHGISHKKYK